MTKNIIKKIIIVTSIFLTLILLIGFLSSKKINLEKKENTLEQKNDQLFSLKQTTSSIFNFDKNILSTSTSFENYFSKLQEFNSKLENRYSTMIENVFPDPQKKIEDYKQEIEKINNEFEQKIKNNKNLNSKTIIDLAEKLASINPPKLLYQAHLEFIKTYLTLGLALEEIENSKDDETKLILYNIIKNITEQIKP